MNGPSKTRIEELTAELLREIGEDPGREGLIRTPTRVAKAWEYIAQGYDQTLEEVVGDACFEESVDEMVTVKDIDFFSLCEHHLLPFFGKAHIGYLPDGKVIGLSKLPRIVDMFARRLQVQERMTQQIGDAIMSVLQPSGVGVVIEGVHMCMQMRGVEKQNSYASTSHMVGVFRDDRKTREEFFNIVGMRRV